MNRLTYVAKWVDAKLFAFTDYRREDRRADNLRIALNVGTTITTRFWISLHSMITGAQLILGEASMFSKVGREIFFRSVPVEWWAGALIFSGLLMLWRAASPNGRPIWGALSNTLSTLLFGTMTMSRVVEVGPVGLLSSSTVLWMMSAWCLVRTGATRRDVETA